MFVFGSKRLAKIHNFLNVKNKFREYCKGYLYIFTDDFFISKKVRSNKKFKFEDFM